MNFRHRVLHWLQRDRANGLRLWPLLVSAVLAFAWVQPHHYYPWPAFHANAIVAFWMVTMMIALFSFGVRPNQWPALAVVLLLMALAVIVQGWLGLIAHGADVAMTALQLFACAVVVAFVSELQRRQHTEILGDVMFAALGLAGLLSVSGALYQVLQITSENQLSGLGVWIMAIPDGVRAAGNVAQPNELATLLMWSLIGGLWAVSRRVMSWLVFVIYASFIAIGLGITQSRIGLIEMVALIVAVAICKQRLGGWRATAALSLAFAVQVGVFVLVPRVAEILLLDYEGRAQALLSSDAARLGIYEHVVTAILERPWIGFGMTTLAPAQWLAADSLPGLHSYFHASHNLILDLMAWWGLPLGLVMTGGLIWWMWAVVSADKSPQQILFGLALMVFALHTLVELPHWSAAYLLPACVFAGVVNSAVSQRVWLVRARLLAVSLGFGAVAMAAVIFDYYRLEQNYNHLRAEERRLVEVKDVPHALVLTHLADYLRMARMIARPNVPPETIQWMERTVTGIPNYNTQFTHAVTLALNGQKEEALKWMRRLNSVSPRHYHPQYERVWRNFQTWYPELLGAMAWPKLAEDEASLPAR